MVDWDVPWGEIHRVGRGGIDYPVAGADFSSGDKNANFSETLFDVKSGDYPGRPGYYLAKSGSMAMMLMFVGSDGIESLSCVPWGQSGQVDSPHFMDQGAQLYSARRMKPTWWRHAELLSHIESRRVLSTSE